MSSIPLPALSLHNPAPPPDPLAQYAQILQLKQMQQAQPLQLQNLQNQNQAGQLANQEAQIQLQDKKAVTAAMQQWDGKDINSLYPLVLKNGGSGQAVFGMKKQALDMESTIAQTAKNQGDAGLANISAQQKKMDSVTGALTPLTDPTKVPDAQLPQALQQTVQSLVQNGMLDPSHAQAAQQLLQSGDPNAIRSGLKQFTNTLLAQSQITSQALDTAKTGQANAAAAKDNATTNYYAQNPQLGAPGVPVDAVQMKAWLAQNPGKTPADYQSHVAFNNPEGSMMRNQLTPSGLTLAAQNYLNSGQEVAGMTRSVGTNAAVINTAAEQGKAANGGQIPNLALNRAQFDVAKSAANAPIFGNGKSLLDKGGTLDQLSKAGALIPQSQLTKLNTLADWKAAATGNGPLARYAATALGVADDYAKVMGGGVGSDTGREQALALVKADASPAARAGAITGIREAVTSQLQGRIGNNSMLQGMYGKGLQPQGGMVTVQIPGSPAGQIPTAALAKFKADHPNATVTQ